MVRKIVLSFFAAMCVLTAGSMVREARADGSFDVCHKGQTITVGSAGAVAAHVKHGDHVGECAPGGGGGGTCVQDCNDAFATCFAEALGDPRAIAACEASLVVCLAECGG